MLGFIVYLQRFIMVNFSLTFFSIDVNFFLPVIFRSQLSRVQVNTVDKVKMHFIPEIFLTN